MLWELRFIKCRAVRDRHSLLSTAKASECSKEVRVGAYYKHTAHDAYAASNLLCACVQYMRTPMAPHM